jgi:hypothetical protein
MDTMAHTEFPTTTTTYRDADKPYRLRVRLAAYRLENGVKVFDRWSSVTVIGFDYAQNADRFWGNEVRWHGASVEVTCTVPNGQHDRAWSDRAGLKRIGRGEPPRPPMQYPSRSARI